MVSFIPTGLGWCQDLPDFRDYMPDSPQVAELLATIAPADEDPPARVDLREYFPLAYDQLELNASASHACVALVEYFNRRAFGKSLEPSALFLHQTADQSANEVGSPGYDLRSHLQAMVTFGMPPARRWRYERSNFERSPEPMLYSFSEPFRTIQYVRLDSRNQTGTDALERVRLFLAAGFPCAFGFSVPSSLSRDADIPYRPTFDFVRGGQAVVAVGYDDNRMHNTRGALLVRSSWGTEWGEDGYGWLPYAYVEEQLASCFWTLLKRDWLETEEFTRPRLDGFTQPGQRRSAAQPLTD